MRYTVAEGVEFMVVAQRSTPIAKSSFRQKLMYVSLLTLEVPAATLFLPIAAVLVLTGILAPLAMMSFAVGTWPFSQAMKLRSAWRSGAVDN
jgi:hypothetical protein